MFSDDFPLYIIQFIFFLRIPQRDSRMPKPMQPLPLRKMLLIMPIVEEIIMQKRTSDQIMLITSDPQLSVDQKTVAGHIYDMTVYRHIAVLDMSACSLKVL